MSTRAIERTVAAILLLAAPCMAAALWPGTAAAGEPPAPDARVRISVWEHGDVENPIFRTGVAKLTGTFVGCEGDAFIIRTSGDGRERLETVPLNDLRSLEIHDGQRSHALTGALIGAAVGIAISAATKTQRHSDEWLGGLADMEENMKRGVAITLATTLAGAGIGASTGSDIWQPVPVPARCVALGRASTPPMRLAFGFTF